MSRCRCGCRPGYAVCDEGKRLLGEGLHLQSLFPPIMSLPLSSEEARLLDRFHAVGDLWLQHIGQFVPDRRS